MTEGSTPDHKKILCDKHLNNRHSYTAINTIYMYPHATSPITTYIYLLSQKHANMKKLILSAFLLAAAISTEAQQKPTLKLPALSTTTKISQDFSTGTIELA
jgi:hypothetical protein